MDVRRRRRSFSSGGDGDSMDRLPDIRGDRGNIAILVFLYILQGIPLGLTAAIPMLLQNRHVSFTRQAEFSLAIWPFSLKLLWAPLVDSIHFRSFGRRKTWLIPSQYLIGIFMIFLSWNVVHWLGDPDSNEEPRVMLLTLLFFAMNFLCATQDIAVDGWALTMLKRENKGYASTCNSVGQTTGYFLGYVVFIALESSTFCNNYIRSVPQPTGIITLPGFMYFWGLIYLIVTTLVAIFKSEEDEPYLRYGLSSTQLAFSSYKTLLKILSLSQIRMFAIILLTVKIGFAASDGLTGLKLIEGGVPKEKIALLAVPLVPLQIILPIFIAKYNNPRRPVDLYIKVIPYRLMFNVVAAFFVYVTPLVLHGTNEVPLYFYIVLLILLAIHQTVLTMMYVQIMAFFAMISDTNSGGTYMTLLNTLCNLGGTWSTTTALWLVDILTTKSCSTVDENNCSTQDFAKMCESKGGTCYTWIDGYYVEIILCTLFGFCWYRWGKRALLKLQSHPLDSWRIPSIMS